MKKVEIGQNAKVNIKWKTLPIDYTREAEKNIIVKFAKKYGIPKENVKVEPIFISKTEDGKEEEYTNEVISNIQEPAFQQKLFKSYIEERGIEGYDMNKILEIDGIINSKMNYEIYDVRKKYSIKWVKWSNFMSYGKDNFFDFTSLNGLVLLASEPANQGGKTTFCLDLLRFLLFGKVTSREGDWTLARAFNNHLPEATECVVEGCICIDGLDYVIKRVLTRPALSRRTEKSKVSQKINYYKVVNGEYIDLYDEDDVENEAGVTATQTNKMIKEAIGNERDFDLMICVDSDNLKGLISLKDTDRGRLISRWVGLLPLEEKDKIAREYFNKTVTPSLYLNKYNKEELKIEVGELKETNEELKKDIKTLVEKEEESSKKIEEYKQTKDTLLQSKRNIDESIAKTDVETVKTAMQNIKAEGAKKRAEMEANSAKLEDVKGVDFDEANYKNMVAEDKNTAIELNNKINVYNRLKNEIEALKSGEYCPTCGAKLKNVDNTQKIQDKEKELSKTKEEGAILRNKLNDIQAKIANLEEDRKKYNEKLRLELVIEKNDVDIQNLIAKYRENERLYKDIKANEEAIANNNRIDANINIVNVNIKTEESVLSSIQREKMSKESDIKTNENFISNYSKIVEIIEKEEVIVKNWKIYLDMVGKNGISKMVLRNVLPMINGELRHLLDGVCDFDVEVSIDDHNDVAFSLIHDGVSSNLASGSGFEQTTASLALRSVLSKISAFSKPSFVVFDEILGGVADENYDSLKLLYDKIIKDYAFILQISHLKAISDWHSSKIIVKKTNNISTIGKI